MPNIRTLYAQKLLRSSQDVCQEGSKLVASFDVTFGVRFIKQETFDKCLRGNSHPLGGSGANNGDKKCVKFGSVIIR